MVLSNLIRYRGNIHLLLTGYAAGPSFDQAGGPIDYLCLPDQPEWKNSVAGDQHSGSIAGVTYELSFSHPFDESNSGGTLDNHPAPCAVCYVDSCRSTVIMLPGKTQCPAGWTKEYGGYLASDFAGSARTTYRSSVMCLDEAPEVAAHPAGYSQSVLYHVEVQCGTLPCALYPNGKELTCVVCSK